MRHPQSSLTARQAWRCALTATTLAIGAVVPGAAAAVADPCAARSTTTAFSAWGDYNDYFLINNGDFESGTRNWSTINRVYSVWDNEPWRVNGWSDRRAARLEPESTLTSVTFCVAEREDNLRFFVRHPPVSGAKLVVQVSVSDETTTTAKTYEIASQWWSGWTPSEPMGFPNLRNAQGEQLVTISFRATGTRANWSIDDVMVDPFKSK